MITVVDVGATKTLVAQFKDKESLINETHFLTPQHSGDFLDELQARLDALSDIQIISMGVPGKAEQGVVVDCANLPLWKNVHLGKILSDRYNCPVLIENDANLAGLSEINLLSPVPDIGLYLTVSTGIGSGLIIGGKLLPQLKQTEIGHMILLFEDKWQEWEKFASGHAIVEHFGQPAQEINDPAIWQEVTERLALGLCAILPVIRPQTVVFGGGVGQYFDRFEKPLRELLDSRLPTYIIGKINLQIAKHPKEAVLYGCYYNAAHQPTA